jgi:hypothetical protein
MIHSKVAIICLQGLDLNPYDSWATHARAHVFESMGRHDEGIEFMKKPTNDWIVRKIWFNTFFSLDGAFPLMRWHLFTIACREFILMAHYS